MSRFLVLLPAPGAEWAQLPESEHEPDLRAACERLASSGELIEFRRLAQ